MLRLLKYFVLAFCLLTLSSFGHAETKIGLGTGIFSLSGVTYGGAVSVPFQIDSTLMIQPFAGYYSDTERADSDQSDYNTSSRVNYSVGTGLYRIAKLLPAFELYYGSDLIAGKVKTNRKYKSTYTYSAGDSFTHKTKDESNGLYYGIKPTLGISYLINDNFSFSLDSGLYLFSGKNERRTQSNSTSDPSGSDDKYIVNERGASIYTRTNFTMLF